MAEFFVVLKRLFQAVVLSVANRLPRQVRRRRSSKTLDDTPKLYFSLAVRHSVSSSLNYKFIYVAIYVFIYVFIYELITTQCPPFGEPTLSIKPASFSAFMWIWVLRRLIPTALES